MSYLYETFFIPSWDVGTLVEAKSGLVWSGQVRSGLDKAIIPVVLPALVLYKGFEKCFKKGHSG